MISCHSKNVWRLEPNIQTLSDSNISSKEPITDFSLHQQWSDKEGWKATLNNFRLIIQPIWRSGTCLQALILMRQRYPLGLGYPLGQFFSG